MRYIPSASTLLVTVALVACAGNGQGLDSNGRPLGSGGSGGGPLTANFTSIQDNVFTPICTACHAGASAPQGLRLDAANSYDLLVGVPSTEVPSVLRVKPGDPDHSYIVQKLEGHAAVGARMPLGGPYLDQATIDVIRQWITDGAQRATASAPQKVFGISSSTPAPGDVLPVSPVNLVVGFTRELDRTRVDASVVRLEAVDVDSKPGNDQPIAADVFVSDANPAALVVTPRSLLPPGTYRLRLATDAIADLSGATLADDVAGGRRENLVIGFAIGEAP